VDDGCWIYQWMATGSGRNVLSNRHDRQAEHAYDLSFGYGNVCMADGHAERIARRATFLERYYDPFWPKQRVLPLPLMPQD